MAARNDCQEEKQASRRAKGKKIPGESSSEVLLPRRNWRFRGLKTTLMGLQQREGGREGVCSNWQKFSKHFLIYCQGQIIKWKMWSACSGQGAWCYHAEQEVWAWVWSFHCILKVSALYVSPCWGTVSRMECWNSSKMQEKNKHRWNGRACDSGPVSGPHEKTMVGSGHLCLVRHGIGGWRAYWYWGL